MGSVLGTCWDSWSMAHGVAGRVTGVVAVLLSGGRDFLMYILCSGTLIWSYFLAGGLD
jgi:hypothetical protein